MLVLPFVRRHKSFVRSPFDALKHADICAVFAHACEGEYMLQAPVRIGDLHETDRKRRPLLLRRTPVTKTATCVSTAGLRIVERTEHCSLVRAVAASSLSCGLFEQQSQLQRSGLWLVSW